LPSLPEEKQFKGKTIISPECGIEKYFKMQQSLITYGEIEMSKEDRELLHKISYGSNSDNTALILDRIDLLEENLEQQKNEVHQKTTIKELDKIIYDFLCEEVLAITPSDIVKGKYEFKNDFTIKEVFEIVEEIARPRFSDERRRERYAKSIFKKILGTSGALRTFIYRRHKLKSSQTSQEASSVTNL